MPRAEGEKGSRLAWALLADERRSWGQNAWEPMPLGLHMQLLTTTQKIEGIFWKMICAHTCGNMYVPTEIDTSYIKVTCIHIHKMHST